jgi:HlyD family secretion protein
VSSTGTLEAVTTVQVGSQVSGTVQALYSDFNSIVRKGDLLATLEPSLFQSQVEQSRANLTRAVAELERSKVVVADAATKLARTRELSARQLVPRTDLENAEVALKSAETQGSAAAQVEQARVVDADRGEPGEDQICATTASSSAATTSQTVAASMQAPTLFRSRPTSLCMRVNAGDERRADRGGRKARFRGCLPEREFGGVVASSLQPIAQQNVVTYGERSTPNGERKLRPGMTANVTIEVVRRDNVLRFRTAHCGSALNRDAVGPRNRRPPMARGPGLAASGRPPAAAPKVW